MTLRAYKRLHLAENQLKAAISLFVAGNERFSVITLAGAADVILAQLVIAQGKKTFTEHSMEAEKERGRDPGSREKYGRGINDLLFINQLKHMDKDEDGFVDLDPEECALAAILKALANYVVVGDPKKDFVLAFRLWVKLNLDPKKYNIHSDPNWKPGGDNAHA